MNFKPKYKTKSSLFNKALNKKKGLKNSRSFAAGGPIKPYYTSNPNDPRIRSYNDSLNLYKGYIMQDYLMGPKNERVSPGTYIPWTPAKLREDRIKKWNPFLKEKIAKDYQNEKDMFTDNPFVSENDKKLIRYYKSLGFTDDNIMYHTSADLVHPTIRAVGTYMDGSALSPIYKKPVQPVQYADPKIVEKQKLLKEAGLYSGDLDGIWGEKSKEAWKKYEESKKTGSTTTTTAKTSTVPTTTSSTERIDRSLYDSSKPWSIPLLPKETNKSTTSSTTTTTKPTTSAVTRTLPPAPKINPDDPWRFMLGNQAYVTYDEPTAQQFAKELGITNLQRGQNLNIDPTTGKYRDYSHLLGKDASGTMTSKEITKYPKLKMMKRGGEVLSKTSSKSKLKQAYLNRYK